ncbi:S8 family peptidase [Thiolapillus sp.]
MRYIRKQLCLLVVITGLVFPAKGFAQASSVIVGFHHPPGEAEQERIQRAGGTIKRVYHLIPAVVAVVPHQAIAGLLDDPAVAYVEEDKAVISIEPEYTHLARDFFAADDAEYGNAWGVLRIGSREVHERGVTGRGVKLAIVDTGIDYYHEDLDGNYRGGYDFVYDDNDPFDDSWNSHGTHIAGIIAAEANGAGVVGVAPEVSLYALKALDGSGFGSLDSIIASIQWAVDNDMDVLNISIAGIESQVLEAACNAAYEAGLLIVAAAGNTFGGEAAFPGAYASVVAVAGTDEADQIGVFSPLAPQVELAAPGLGIWSSAQQGGYIEASGTSQSAAHVSAAAALVISSGAADFDNDGITSNQEVRQRLQATAEDLGDAGKDEQYGYGLVDVAAAAVPDDTYIRLESKPRWRDSLQRITLENAHYRISIENDSLNAVIILVRENQRMRKDLVETVLFVSPWEDLPQQIRMEMDATATALEIIMLPLGRAGAFADVVVSVQE